MSNVRTETVKSALSDARNTVAKHLGLLTESEIREERRIKLQGLLGRVKSGDQQAAAEIITLWPATRQSLARFPESERNRVLRETARKLLVASSKLPLQGNTEVLALVRGTLFRKAVDLYRQKTRRENKRQRIRERLQKTDILIIDLLKENMIKNPEIVRPYIDSLTGLTKIIYQAHFVEGLPSKQIQQKYPEISPKSLKVLLHRIRSRLETALGVELPEGSIKVRQEDLQKLIRKGTVDKIYLFRGRLCYIPKEPEGKSEQTKEPILSKKIPDVHTLEKASKGDIQALGEVYDDYFDRVYRYALTVTQVTSRAQVLVGRIFEEIFTRLTRGDYDGKFPFSIWLFKICYQIVHKNTDWQQSRLSRHESQKLGVLAMIGKLSQREREILGLEFAADLSTLETAMVLNRGTSFIIKHQTDALKRLTRV